jgi:hypothetical protein
VAVVERLERFQEGVSGRRRWKSVGWEGTLLLAGALAAGVFAALATRGFRAPRALDPGGPGGGAPVVGTGGAGAQPLK